MKYIKMTKLRKQEKHMFIKKYKKKKWRFRELNPGHCGYEPHALTT